MINDIEKNIMESKRTLAVNDFDLLLQDGNIAFYQGCEVTHIFLYNTIKKYALNYFTLFVFDEIEEIDETKRFLSPRLEKIDKTYSIGILQRRVSIDKAKELFQSVQKGRMDIDGDCLLSDKLTLLPKAYVPKNPGRKPLVLNKILKPNYWGDNYIIEFFDEAKAFFESDGESRAKIEKANNFVKEINSIKIDLTKVYDRIGNIIFQFPITVLTTQIQFIKDKTSFFVKTKPHPNVSQQKCLRIEMSSHLDGVISGFVTADIWNMEADTDIELKIGDDYDLTTYIYEKEKNLILHQSVLNFTGSIYFSGLIGMQYAEPRTIQLSNSDKKVEIELFLESNFGGVNKIQNDYYERIIQRNQNNEIITKSGFYRCFRSKQHDDALNYIREKLVGNAIKEICLWDPYLRADDILNTLYYENTYKPFRCITSYQKAHNKSEDNFESFCSDQKNIFETCSNNLGVTLKFLAQHDRYGWKFHDRFLILIPKDSTQLPDVYSLGTSVNSVGKEHHIIQKVTDPKVITNNFEELWKALDNKDCVVVEIKSGKLV